MREPSDSAAAAAEILDRVGGRWALIGALAALRYRATPRMTTDVDVLADPVDGLSAAFEADGPTLDETYIEHWAVEWDVLDRWHEARVSR